jgi:tight adherence protein C
MVYLIAALIAITVGLVVATIAQLMPARPATVGRRLAELQAAESSPFTVTQRRGRMKRRERWEAVLKELGERAVSTDGDVNELRKRMLHAGYTSPAAPGVFMGARIGLPVIVLLGMMTLVPFAGTQGLLFALLGAGFAWLAPSFVLDSMIRKRQGKLRRALPDTLDLMVTTVEAGLGLNQAIVRVAQEISTLSPEMAKELTLVNLEIRAGKSREEALRGLGERTGLDDLRSLAAMLIQTDRFGTSVVQALRVHADTMRVKRRQRAEEEAAKTTVKILFPLLVFIFPALFVIIIGPAGIRIFQELIQK